MHTRRIARFRPRRAPSSERPELLRKVLMYGGSALVALAAVALVWGLWWVPEQFTNNAFLELQQKYSDQHFEDGQRVERHWMEFPYLAPFTQGDEAWVQAFLVQQPLVAALFERKNPDRVWVREGDRLIRMTDSPELQRYRQWHAKAEAARRFQWTPPDTDNPEAGQVAVTVLLGDRYALLKRWEPGSPRVEEALHRVFGAKAPSRIGLVHKNTQTIIETLLKQPWGAEPNYQVDPVRVHNSPITFSGASDLFGEGWTLEAMPWRTELRQLGAQFTAKQWTARGISAAVALALAGGIWLRWRVRRRETLDADRLAALTHSLKTPLAVLKFRCDSLRLGRVKGDQAEVELMRISEEVDSLTAMIGQGLAAIRGVPGSGPQKEVSPVWLMSVAEDLHGAFETEGRLLELLFCGDSGKANLSSLRPALQTLLENALHHGKGKVVMESSRKGRKFFLRVSDEGPGLDSLQLEALGKPFMRFRSEGSEGFTREGMGLGLSLLCQVAQQEGWGLNFSSEPGKGFHAQLTLESA